MSLGFVSARTEQARLSRLQCTEGNGNGGTIAGGTSNGGASTGGTIAGGAAPSATAGTTGGTSPGSNATGGSATGGTGGGTGSDAATGGATVDATSEKGQEGANEAVPPRDDDNNNKSKLTLSVATVCGDGEGTDEGDPPVLFQIYLPYPLVIISLICPNVPTLPIPLSLLAQIYLPYPHGHIFTSSFLLYTLS